MTTATIFLEIRAGAGGDEAAIFAGDHIPHVIHRYAEAQRWQVELINANHSEQGGYKQIIYVLLAKALTHDFLNLNPACIACNVFPNRSAGPSSYIDWHSSRFTRGCRDRRN